MTNPQSRRLAVITGGSSGIGLELARICAGEDFDLVLVAERGVDAAAEILREGLLDVQTVTADLGTYEGNEQVVAAVEALGRPVDLLALNAGVGVGGAFLETSLTDDLNLLDVNIGSVLHLAKRLVPAMTVRREGRVLITASIAATMPGPFYATYAASKSFLLSFSEAFRLELADTGVTVTALLPGPTDTDFFDRADMDDTAAAQGSKDDPAAVAQDAFDAAMAGKEKVVGGSVKNTLQAAAAKVLPEPVKAALHATMTKPQND